MKQRKVISLPTDEGKIYRQILAFMGFMLNVTPQERDVLAELIRLDNEYSALPQEKRGKFILSTDIRKEIRTTLKIEEKQFNIIISRLKKKVFVGKPLLGENNEIHKDLLFTPDEDGFRIEVNLVMTAVKPKPFVQELDEAILEKHQEESEVLRQEMAAAVEAIKPPTEYKHDASQAPVIEEEDFDITIAPVNK
jgi:hypothetical protein